MMQNASCRWASVAAPEDAHFLGAGDVALHLSEEAAHGGAGLVERFDIEPFSDFSAK